MFTTGPWIVSSSTLVCDSEARIIANCTSFLDVPDLNVGIKEAVDNARLIAAAPEMYDLLKWYQENFTPNEMMDSKLDKLLAKIEGR